jgi:hypothetical protein
MPQVLGLGSWIEQAARAQSSLPEQQSALVAHCFAPDLHGPTVLAETRERWRNVSFQYVM